MNVDILLKPAEKHRCKQTLAMLYMLAEGYGLGEIADKIGLSKRTVEAHSMNLQRMMGARSIAHAVAIAFKRGWLQIDLLEMDRFDLKFLDVDNRNAREQELMELYLTLNA